MANVTIPYADPGRAAFEELDTYFNVELLAGNHPELKPAYHFDMANDTSFEQFSVVGLDANNKLALATTGNVDPADDIKPIGVLPHAAALGATGTLKAAVWYSGHFNIDTLVWDASYATDELKTMAFHGAPSPTTILASKGK